MSLCCCELFLPGIDFFIEVICNDYINVVLEDDIKFVVWKENETYNKSQRSIYFGANHSTKQIAAWAQSEGYSKNAWNQPEVGMGNGAGKTGTADGTIVHDT